MASVAASQFVSRTTHAVSFTETKSGLIQTELTKGHIGLRPLNQIDNVKLRSSNTKALVKKVKSKHDQTAFPVVCGAGMNIVFISTEVGPWSKTGGLGDVVGALPPALAAMGHRVMTIAPRYDQYKDGWDTSVVIRIQVGNKTEIVRFFHCYKRGVDRVFVDHPMFLEKVRGKTGSKVYGPKAGTDYKDNQLRFSLLCQAALEAPRVLNLNSSKQHSGPYGEDVVFVANDWHTALLPCYLKSMYQSRGIYRNAKVAFCIHNIAYQGRFAFSDFSMLNLPAEFKSSFDFMDGYTKPVKGRKINWMKAGILESHRVVTVSPYYAKELIANEAKGVELDHIIRSTGITGIVNGMDVQEWNPVTDKYIDVHYDHTTVTEAKALLKEALQAEVGLPVDRNIPLIGFIGRLEEQKGSDILAEAIPHFISENVQIVVLGTGKKYMEKQLEELEIKYPDNARGIAKFNVPLAHMITAGSDFMLVPSRFEPCVDPEDVMALATTVTRALASYGTTAMKEMIQNCMAQELSWKEPAKLWEKLLLSMEVIGEPGTEGEEIDPLAKENVATP
ncbi:hypothetical protein V2J09_022183 [Rumex salicifolius]